MSFLQSAPCAEKYVLQWYAAYVCVRHEKRIADQLARRAIEHYLPLYQKQYRWNQRQWTAQLPLFPGYVFVRIPLKDRVRVLEIPNVVHLVEFAGRPAVLSNEEVETMRRALSARKAEPHPYLTVGRRVRINSGVLAGVEGVISRRKKRLRIIVSVDGLHRSIAFELCAADVEVLSKCGVAAALAA